MGGPTKGRDLVDDVLMMSRGTWKASNHELQSYSFLVRNIVLSKFLRPMECVLVKDISLRVLIDLSLFFLVPSQQGFK